MTNDDIKDLQRLKFEDLLWLIFGIICFINIYGDYLQKEYIYTHLNNYEKKANKTFLITLTITFLIYIYFFLRNYKKYKNSTKENEQLYKIKLLGSIFLIAGIICLIYFQKNNPDFIGTPNL
jgi:cbb3-type cytochrome oxidase subunit 3